MPENLDFNMYFNIAFFGVIGLAFLFGYMRGLKKSLYSLVTTLIFYVLFFTTIEYVINYLWITPIPTLGEQLAQVDPSFSGVSTLGDALAVAIDTFVNQQALGGTLSPELLENTTFVSLTTGLAQFALKLVYTLVYFTVGNILYRFIMLIIRAIFFSGGKKRKGQSKHRLFGAIVGACKGAVTVYVGLIMLGGMMSITESMLTLIPDESSMPEAQLEVVYLSTNHPQYQALDNPLLDEEQESILDMGREMVAAYNNNMFVVNTGTIVMEDENYSEAVPLNLYLFDSVLSFSFQNENVYIRNELEVVADVGRIFMDSEFAETQEVTDISKEDVVGAFQAVANSDFIVNVMPLAIEFASEAQETPIDIPTDELYDIDWRAELNALGAVAGTAFDILNTSGVLAADADYETVTFDGTEVRGLFDELAESELVTLGAYLALEPLLESSSDTLSAVITVPEDLVWEDEFRAFGEVAESVLNSGITLADMEADDPSTLITTMADVDFTVLLKSQIVSHALKNIFSGDAGIEGMDMIVVPNGVVWFDTYDGDTLIPGELRHILSAVNAIADDAEGFSFDDMGLETISAFQDTTIDAIFESRILVATVSDVITNMDFGDTAVIIPDGAKDDDGYITSTELKLVVKSAKVLVEDLACDEGDTECENGSGFDMAKAFDLSDTSVDTLTESQIIGATVGQMIVDMAGDTITVPNSAMSEIFVDGVSTDVVSREEIKAMLTAVGVLNFTDLENMDFDASMISNLALDTDETTLDTDKTADLYASKILHATISTMLFDQTEGAESTLSVPYFDQTGTVQIRVPSVEDEMDYLSTDELDAVLQALITLDITDFESMDTLDINTVIDNSEILLESTVLQATISKQLLDMGSDVLVIPEESYNEEPVLFTPGNPVEGTDTNYIDKTELINTLNAIKVFGIEDITAFEGDLDLATIFDSPDNIDTLLESNIIHATLSDKLLDLDADGTIVVPPKSEIDQSVVRKTVQGTEFINETEIRAMLDALDILGLTQNIDTFDGNLDLDPLSVPADRTVALSSVTIRATMSRQIIDLDTDGTLTMPYFDQDNLEVRVTESGVEFIRLSELEALIVGLDIISGDDPMSVSSFDGNVSLATLTEGDNFATLLDSAMIHATVSTQILDLETDPTMTAAFVVPYYNTDDVLMRISVGDEVAETDTIYVLDSELEAMIDAMNVLNVLGEGEGLDSFNGTVELDNFYDEGNRNVLLTSAILHATVSEQLLDLSTDGTMTIPLQDINGVDIQETHGLLEEATTYITDAEIHALFESLEVLGIDDVNSFAGDFTFTNFETGAQQDTLLGSASIHATISKTLLDLDDAVLIVPNYTEAGELPGNEIRKTVSATEFVVKGEIKALIDAFNAMGYGDLDSFNASLDSSEFFTNRTTLLLSSSIQVTLSDKLLTGTNGDLIVPNVHVRDGNAAVRIVQTDVTYVSLVEINRLFDALEVLGLTDFTNLDFSPTTIFNLDFETLIASASMQATVSYNLLPSTLTAHPDSSSTTTLIVPTYFRETIAVGAGTEVQVEYVELLALLAGLDVLDITNFSDSMSGSTITNLTGEDIDVLLDSGSIHTTIDDMLRGNTNISGSIHSITMEEDLAFKTGILYDYEIKAFILATKEASQTDFATVNFDLTTLLTTAGSASSRNVIFDSMIIRNVVNDDVVTLSLNPLDPYLPALTNTDYMDDNNTYYLKKASMLAVLEHVSPTS